MAKAFYISVLAVIKAQNQVLVIHKTKFNDGTPRDIWGLPGGKMEHGETEFATLKRELSEELGLLLEDQKISYLGHIMPGGHEFSFKDGVGSCNLIYQIELEKTFTPNFSNENESYNWLDYSEFLKTKLFSVKVPITEIGTNLSI